MRSIRGKGTKQAPAKKILQKNKKVPENRFQALASEGSEPAKTTIAEKEDIQQENNEEELVLKIIGK